MIEIVFGLFLAAIAAALAMGLAPPTLPIQGFQQTLSFVIGAIAALVILHALYRRFRDRREGVNGGIRTIALMGVTLAALGLLIFATIAKTGAASINGWPAGYLLISHGVMLAMLILFNTHKRKQNAIEGEGQRANQSGGS